MRRQVVTLHIIGQILSLPAGEWIDLDPTTTVFLEQRKFRACRALETLATGNPGRKRLDGALEWQRLANMTAGVRRGLVQQSVGVGARQILLIRPNDPYVGQPEVRA